MTFISYRSYYSIVISHLHQGNDSDCEKKNAKKKKVYGLLYMFCILKPTYEKNKNFPKLPVQFGAQCKQAIDQTSTQRQIFWIISAFIWKINASVNYDKGRYFKNEQRYFACNLSTVLHSF